MTQLWVEVFNAVGVRQGEGYIKNVKSVSVTRKLDKAGAIRIDIPGTDERATSLLVNEAIVKAFVVEGDVESADYVKREIASGIIRQRDASDTSSDWTLSVSGPDILAELDRKNTFLALQYNSDTHTPPGSNWTIEEIADDLAAKVTGWTASISSTGEHYVRFDGMSILKAFTFLAKEKGIHFRLAESGKTIEVGTFGTSNGISLVQPTMWTPALEANDDIGLIETFRMAEDSHDKIDLLVPLAAGEGETRLTLEKCTRSIANGDPYDVQTTIINGKQVWYISNGASDPVEDIRIFDQIQIQSNTDADIETGANALYDVAVAWFIRRQETLKSYDVKVLKLRSTVRPGDKIHVTYKGFIEYVKADGTIGLLPPQNINEEMWVMEVSESVSSSGLSTQLKLSNIDRVMMDEVQILVGELESAQIKNLSVKAYTSNYVFPFKQEVDSTHTVSVPVWLDDRTLRARQILLRVMTRPFRATARSAQSSTSSSGGGTTQSSEAGGDHHHEMGAFTGPAIGTGTRTGVAIFNTSGSLSNLIVEKTVGSLTETWRTSSSSGSHSHNVTIPPHTHDIPEAALNYGIEDDTAYPEDVTVSVDGVDVTYKLANRGTIATGIDEIIDITDEIVDSAFGLQALHEITIGCEAGQGLVIGVVKVYEDIQNLG